MNTETKIHLSKIETELIQNKEWILTKRTIINKVYRLFGEMHKIYKEISDDETSSLIEFYKNTGGKISKGENYNGFPYVIMDYPASFSKEKYFRHKNHVLVGKFFQHFIASFRKKISITK